MFYHKQILLGTEENKKNKTALSLEPGRYIWPIRLWLPAQCPPSLLWDSGRHGVQVQYQLEAIVHTKGALQRDKKAFQPIRVLCRYISPKPYVRESSMSFMGDKEKKLVISAVTDSSECYPGQDISIHISLTNQTKKVIKSGTVSLFGYCTARACGYNLEGGWAPCSLDLAKCPELLPIEPGEQKQARVKFRIPSDSQPTIMLQNGSLSWCITVQLRYGLKSKRVAIPVIMQPLCPKSLQFFPVIPVMGTSEEATLAPGALFVESNPNFMPWWSFLP